MSGTPTFVLTWYFGPSSSAHLAVALRPPAAAVPLACTRVPRAQGSGGHVFARAHLAWALPSLEQYTRAQSSHTAPPSLEWYRSAPRVRRCPHWSSTPTHRAVALRHPHWSGTAVHRSLGAAHNARRSWLCSAPSTVTSSLSPCRAGHSKLDCATGCELASICTLRRHPGAG